ncbi:helix-turn-helix transcriptional regulator [Thermoactinomyces sp. CICC 10521]|uniref:helix-turn-helix domain-containing protein n=1 Tax=Thermoactinomyces sp. CICC 10521 TaxID=2767426 RepID=UPI0018DBFD8D|nr:helix-turn-helix transcriptional regulator [Thermoactinomyces sp. CICC 10521]MBH8608924.1 helix-turn-helix transcriptional regulator [Thermoactinomyces sp. CICC 10521]
MISFRPFRQWLVANPKRKQSDLVREVGLHPRTANKVWNDENVNLETVNRICEYYSLRVEQVIEYLEDQRFAVDIENKKAYLIDEGIQSLVDAEGIYDGEEADRFILDQLNADLIIEAPDEEKALEIAQKTKNPRE